MGPEGHGLRTLKLEIFDGFLHLVGNADLFAVRTLRWQVLYSQRVPCALHHARAWSTLFQTPALLGLLSPTGKFIAPVSGGVKEIAVPDPKHF